MNGKNIMNLLSDLIPVDMLIGMDVSALLNIQKWDPPMPADLAGQAAGYFPHFIKKTDQERCQNLYEDIFIKNKDTRYEVTMKLDGTSFTAFYVDKEEGVCGRNLELKVNEQNEGNALVRMYVDSGLQDALRKVGRNLALQGELMGPKIQANRENFKSHRLYTFDIYDIDGSCQLNPYDRRDALQSLYDAGLKKDYVYHVPIFAFNVSLQELGISNIADLLMQAEGPSIVHPVREGDVYKSMDGQFSFKAISNQFLLKVKD
jgi:RNA ligase (TIGR02306 family)